MSKCNWDPSKHGGKPCPVHGAGGNAGTGGHKIRINAGKYEMKLSDDSDWEEISDKEYNDLREGGYQEFDETIDDDFGFDEEDEDYQEYIDKVNEDLEKVVDKKSAEYVADEIDNLTEAGYISEEMSDKLYAELDKKIDENVSGMPLYNSRLAKKDEETHGDKVKIGAKEMTKNEWKDWYHKLDNNNREMGREFLLNHASEFNMSENELGKFLDKSDATTYDGAEVIGGDDDIADVLKDKTPLTEEESKSLDLETAIKNADDDVLDEQFGKDTPERKLVGAMKEKTQKFSKRPLQEDYGIDKDLKKQLNDFEYYHTVENPDEEIDSIKKWRDKAVGQSYADEDYLGKFDRDIALLSNPKIRKYIEDRNSFDKQFENDFNEYKEEAKQKYLEKILGENDLYEYESRDDYEKDKDDLFDDINSNFAKRYGYERTKYGNMFSPLRNTHAFSNYYGEDENYRDDSGSYRRRKLNRDKVIGDLLGSGVITFADLKKFLKGK